MQLGTIVTMSFQALFGFMVAAQPAQEARQIELASWGEPPVQITEVRYKGERLTLVGVGDVFPRATVAANDDWVSELSVVVKNVSSRTVTHFSVEQMNQGGEVRFSDHLGRTARVRTPSKRIGTRGVGDGQVRAGLVSLEACQDNPTIYG